MAKLITKFKYLKPSARQSVGGYAKYIATREGVEKVDETFKNDPPTEKQKKLIDKMAKRSSGMMRKPLPTCPLPQSTGTPTPSSFCTASGPTAIGLCLLVRSDSYSI